MTILRSCKVTDPSTLKPPAVWSAASVIGRGCCEAVVPGKSSTSADNGEYRRDCGAGCRPVMLPAVFRDVRPMHSMPKSITPCPGPEAVPRHTETWNACAVNTMPSRLQDSGKPNSPRPVSWNGHHPPAAATARVLIWTLRFIRTLRKVFRCLRMPLRHRSDVYAGLGSPVSISGAMYSRCTCIGGVLRLRLGPQLGHPLTCSSSGTLSNSQPSLAQPGQDFHPQNPGHPARPTTPPVQPGSSIPDTGSAARQAPRQSAASGDSGTRRAGPFSATQPTTEPRTPEEGSVR